MKTFLITNQNFATFDPYVEQTIQPVTITWKRQNQNLVLSINSMAHFAVFLFQDHDFFAISNRLYTLEEYISQHGYHLEFNPDIMMLNRSKPDVVKAISCSNVEHITNWKEITFFPNGTYKIIPNEQPFQIPLVSDGGVDILLDWLTRYRIRTRLEAEKGTFVPTLTGGVDTRILTWFWRDLPNISQYYCKDVKPDHKNSVTKGQEEIKIVEELLPMMGVQLERVGEFSPNQVTLSGILTEGARDKKQLNDPRFVTEYMTHHFSAGAAANNFVRNLWLGEREICPFVDDEYLKLIHPSIYFMRTLLVQLCCPDLVHKRFYSFSALPMYHYLREFGPLWDETEKVIQQYDLHKKVQKIHDTY